MQMFNPIKKKKIKKIKKEKKKQDLTRVGWLMNACSSKLPMAECGRLTRLNFRSLKRGK